LSEGKATAFKPPFLLPHRQSGRVIDTFFPSVERRRRRRRASPWLSYDYG
jgi:hypothetical protein